MTTKTKKTINFVKGDSFQEIIIMPDSYPDGYFSDRTIKSQMKTSSGIFMSEITCTWVDPTTTRHLMVTVTDTSSWKIGSAEFDVKFTRESDGFVKRTRPIQIYISRGVTD